MQCVRDKHNVSDMTDGVRAWFLGELHRPTYFEGLPLSQRKDKGKPRPTAVAMVVVVLSYSLSEMI